MKLQILIPQYTETEETIKLLLDSIALQQSIDFKDIGIIIVNDGTDIILSEKFLDQYKFNIKYIINDINAGVSVARNIALDAATADYVMFCDADDMFRDMTALFFIFEQIQNRDFNILIPSFSQETLNEDNKIYYIERGNQEADATFVHGKVFNRKFLIDNNIKWNSKLRIHEDSYFNCLAINTSKKEDIIYYPNSYYIWKANPNSVSRKDKNYIPNTYVQMLNSNDELINQLMARNNLDAATQYICGMIYQAYYELNFNPIWQEKENQDKKAETINRFKKYFNKYGELFKTVSDDIKASILLKSRPVNYIINLTGYTFENWIDAINRGE